ncbi:MAG TPA: zf-HC2 domain-containing protein [Propionibacteriaceae bacterium]|nr:zf-HC2 domain-containing protein [Propionibacteriaceae bacterium]
MTDPPYTDDECVRAFEVMQAFLHHELNEVDADHVRAHLDVCEACLESFDVETAITTMIQRCQPPAQAPQSLRLQIMSLTMRRKQ